MPCQRSPRPGSPGQHRAERRTPGEWRSGRRLPGQRGTRKDSGAKPAQTPAARTAAARATEPGSAGARAPQSRSAEALEVEVRGTVRAAESLAAQDRVAEPPWAEAAEVQTPEAEAGEAEILEGRDPRGRGDANREPGGGGRGNGAPASPEGAASGHGEATSGRPDAQPGPAAAPPSWPAPAQGQHQAPPNRRAGMFGRAARGAADRGPARSAGQAFPRRRCPAETAPYQARTGRSRGVRRGRGEPVRARGGQRHSRPRASAAPAGTAGHSMTRIVVQPGQTLWTIAMRADPQADPRQVVQQIIAANALPRRQRSSWPASPGAAGLRCSGAGPAPEPHRQGRLLRRLFRPSRPPRGSPPKPRHADLSRDGRFHQQLFPGGGLVLRAGSRWSSVTTTSSSYNRVVFL